jgi:hypothetical protein
MSQSSNCPCPLPPINHINGAVNCFNHNQTNLKLDAALHEIFSPPPGGSRLALCAFALDSLWNAGINRRHYQDWPDVYNGFLHRIAHLQRLAQAIRSHPLPVPQAKLDQEVIPPSLLLLNNLLDLVQHINYYVFATKFMHWWVGTPPIDKNAAAAISRLCNGLETGAGVGLPGLLDRFAESIHLKIDRKVA